jgi:hypothetical protein
MSAGLSQSFYRLRQSSIDEELFDVITGIQFSLSLSPKTRLRRYESHDRKYACSGIAVQDGRLLADCQLFICRADLSASQSTADAGIARSAENAL